MDWVKYGFGPDYLPHDPKLPFYINYNNAIPTTDKTPLEISKEAIERISSKYPAPYTLMCSGGVDSQAMILAWKHSGVPFRIVSARYNDNMNDYDLVELNALAEREGLSVDYLDIDVIDFHENHLQEWAKTYNCTTPHILTHMYIASKITEGTVVSSGNYVLSIGKFGAINYGQFGLQRYSEISKQPMVPYFWMHDQYLMPVFEIIRRQQGIEYEQLEKNGYHYKCLLFQLAGFDVIPQPRKYNGFEKLKEHYDSVTLKYTDILKAAKNRKDSRDASLRPYDILFRHRLEEVTPYYGLFGQTIINW